MPRSYSIMTAFNVSFIFSLMLFLSACDSVQNLFGNSGGEEVLEEVTTRTFAVAPQTAWMPWFLADSENVFHQYKDEYRVDIEFVTGDYQELIKRFVLGELDAMMITNIDAITELVRQDIETDVILITDYSNGNDAILLPSESSDDLNGKVIALTELSSRHYIMDRYLTRNQIPFDAVSIQNTEESMLIDAFNQPDVYGIAATNPVIETMLENPEVRVLFDSRQIPGEIMGVLVVNRTIRQEYPGFSQALLATWFSLMERLQGNRREPTLEALAQLANQPAESYGQQLEAVKLNDSIIKALSAIRDRRTMRKAMRHIRYFMERHDLTSDEPFNNWVSYPGRTPAVLHFNAEPLQDFVAPPEAENI